MKQILLLSALFTSLFSFGQIINFPDANLKTKLLSPNTAGYFNPNYTSVNLDSNGDGEIEVSETLLAERINIANSNISSLEGLEYFPNLKNIVIHGNPIPTNSLMALSQIKEVWLGSNGWTMIDSSVIPQNITFLRVDFDSTITQFCPNTITQLKLLYLNNYPYSDLNLCNTAVQVLAVSATSALTTVNLKNNYISPPYYNMINYKAINTSNLLLPPPPASISIIGGNTSVPYTIYVDDAMEAYYIQDGWYDNSVQFITNAPPCDTSVICANALTTPTLEYFTTYPNPVETTMTLSNTFNKTIDHLTVFALDGKVVYQQSNVAQEIDMSSLLSGLYLLKIECNDGSVYTKKILKK